MAEAVRPQVVPPAPPRPAAPLPQVTPPPPVVQAPPQVSALPPLGPPQSPAQVAVIPPAEAAPLPVPAPAAPVKPVEKEEVRAALLVPLSGPQAGLGQAMSNAAQLALFELGDARFNLIPLDTKGTAEGAAAAARQALAQGADIFLGPLFSGEVKAAAPLAREQAVPMLAFTTDRAAVGNGVYTLGFLPNSQVSRVVGYARSQGKQRFAILARSDDYGRAVADAFRAAVPEQGGQVVKVEFYDPQAADLTPVVKRFTEVDARSRAKAKDAAAPIAPASFDAVLLPDEGTRLRSLASLLTYFEIDPAQVRFLGTLLWDDARLGAEPALQGGWYPAAAMAAHQDFDARYGKAFGALPARLSAIASIAYDATALAATLARQGHVDYSVTALTNPNGFAGVDGIFRLSADGSSERGMAVREVTQTGPKEVSPAPASFTVPGQ